jgi:ribonuclease Y
MVRNARREAEKAKRAGVLEAKQEILACRNKADRDMRSRRKQLQKRERELKNAVQAQQEQEALLARSEEEIREATSRLGEQEREIGISRRQVDRLLDQQNEALERVSGMTRDEARRQLLANLKAQTRYEAAAMIKEIKDEAQRSAEGEATKILSLAMERMASEFSAQRAVSQFKLPEGSDLRGRIIGHEGKNIRAFESATGIQLVLDEETNTVTLSGYHPVKREVARRVLETLVKDGNIRPKRIEDLTRRNQRRLEDEMRKAGQEAVKELRLKGVLPEIIKLLGRLSLRTSYGQNVLQHSKEVAWLTGMMAAELRVDEKLARRAGLLHDIGKAIDYEREGTHPEIGAEIAARCGEHEFVVNAIASHQRSPSTSSGSKSWKSWPTRCRASSNPTPCRRGARSGSSPGPSRSTTRTWICSPPI